MVHSHVYTWASWMQAHTWDPRLPPLPQPCAQAEQRERLLNGIWGLPGTSCKQMEGSVRVHCVCACVDCVCTDARGCAWVLRAQCEATQRTREQPTRSGRRSLHAAEGPALRGSEGGGLGVKQREAKPQRGGGQRLLPLPASRGARCGGSATGRYPHSCASHRDQRRLLCFCGEDTKLTA